LRDIPQLSVQWLRIQASTAGDADLGSKILHASTVQPKKKKKRTQMSVEHSHVSAKETTVSETEAALL